MVNSPRAANRYVRFGTVRTSWTDVVPIGAGTTGSGSGSAATSDQRWAKRSILRVFRFWAWREGGEGVGLVVEQREYPRGAREIEDACHGR